MEITAFVEPLVIFLILIVNAVVGIWQESNSREGVGGAERDSVGDGGGGEGREEGFGFTGEGARPWGYVELRVGDKVPADMRVLSLVSSTVRVEQGALTGESEAVSKTVAENADIQGKKCMVFAGTTVVNGNCVCLVTQIGMKHVFNLFLVPIQSLFYISCVLFCTDL